MTFAMLEKLLPNVLPKELQTKVNFDTVESQAKKMPEIAVSGVSVKTGDSDGKPQLNGNHYTPIVAEPLNFRKEIGSVMSEETVERFVKIPRELFEDENFKGMRVAYQRLFFIILEEASFTTRTFNHNGKTIPVLPGQLCVTFRRLAELYNKGLRFKQDKITSSLVQRAVSVFLQFGFAIHESIHGIMRLTITQRELCAHFKKQTDTGSDSKPIQNRYINEERKEGKEIKETIDGADRSPLLDKEKKEEQGGASIFDVEPALQTNDLSEEKKKMLPELWKYAINMKVSEGNTKCPKPGIKQSDIAGWLKIYEVKDIAEAIKLTSDKTIRITYGAYITTLLKERVPKKKGNLQINDEFLQEIMKKHKCSHLQDTKQYVTDTIKHVDYQKNTDPKMFKDMIMASLAMASNYDQREGDYRQESEYEDDY